MAAHNHKTLIFIGEKKCELHQEAAPADLSNFVLWPPHRLEIHLPNRNDRLSIRFLHLSLVNETQNGEELHRNRVKIVCVGGLIHLWP